MFLPKGSIIETVNEFIRTERDLEIWEGCHFTQNGDTYEVTSIKFELNIVHAELIQNVTSI